MRTPVAGCDASHNVLQRLFVHGGCHVEERCARRCALSSNVGVDPLLAGCSLR